MSKQWWMQDTFSFQTKSFEERNRRSFRGWLKCVMSLNTIAKIKNFAETLAIKEKSSSQVTRQICNLECNHIINNLKGKSTHLLQLAWKSSVRYSAHCLLRRENHTKSHLESTKHYGSEFLLNRLATARLPCLEKRKKRSRGNLQSEEIVKVGEDAVVLEWKQ